jgi:hypothetical protein
MDWTLHKGKTFSDLAWRLRIRAWDGQAAGSSTVKVAPCPGRLSTWIVP